MYDAAKNDQFSRRVRAFMLRVQSLREEAKRLVAIYQNETGSGAHEDFSGTEIATKEEHIDAIVWMMEFANFNDNAPVPQNDRQQWITPFLQQEG